MGTKKIRKRYAILVLIAIIMSVTVIGALSNFAIWSKTNRDVVSIMNVTTESKAASLDLVLLEIRDAVDTVGAYVGARVASADLQPARETVESADAVRTAVTTDSAKIARTPMTADSAKITQTPVTTDSATIAQTPVTAGTAGSVDTDVDEEIQELFLSSVEHVDGVVGYSVRFAQPYDSMVSSFSFQRGSDSEPYYPADDADGLDDQQQSVQSEQSVESVQSEQSVESMQSEQSAESMQSEQSAEDGEDAEDGVDAEDGEDGVDAEDGVDRVDDWYELAVAAGHPIWIPIRECSYTGGYVLSYVVPFYFGDELVGAACVDVDFEVLAKPVRDISIFEGGYAYLTDDKGKVFYHPLIGYGVLLTEDEDDVPEVDAALADTSNHGELITYEYQGQKKRMAFQSLLNDMRLVVTANENDVMKETLMLTQNIIIAAVVIILIFVFLALKLEKWTMHPVLDKMDSLAHLDGLTGLQNRTSFLEMQDYLNGKIAEGNAVFGIVMFDANNLKMINDEYGHKMGDAYLLSVVEMIQDCFPGCQAYRIGGDEFIVLAEGEEAIRLAPEQLEAAYRWQTRRKGEKRDPWEMTSAAGAFVCFNSQTHHNLGEVLSEVDQQMYRKKQEMKSS